MKTRLNFHFQGPNFAIFVLNRQILSQNWCHFVLGAPTFWQFLPSKFRFQFTILYFMLLFSYIFQQFNFGPRQDQPFFHTNVWLLIPSFDFHCSIRKFWNRLPNPVYLRKPEIKYLIREAKQLFPYLWNFDHFLGPDFIFVKLKPKFVHLFCPLLIPIALTMAKFGFQTNLDHIYALLFFR